MKYRRLGTTDMEVSAVTMGCWAFAGGVFWGDQNEADSIAAVDAAIDAGINFFDTAEGYGSGLSEEVLGKAVKGKRDKVLIASKVSSGHLAPKDVASACEGSLKRLRTDRIDLYQVHWPGKREVPFADTYAALVKLRDQGKIRAIGVSNFGVEDLDTILESGRVEADQLPYSLLWRAVEFDIRDKCVENDISILCYSPIAQGLLTGKFASPDEVPPVRRRTRLFSSAREEAEHGEEGAEEETFAAVEKVRVIAAELGTSMERVALAWLMAQPGVTSVIAGARSPAQIAANAGAADLELPDEVMRRVTGTTDALKAGLGPNPDMWNTAENSRYR